MKSNLKYARGGRGLGSHHGFRVGETEESLRMTRVRSNGHPSYSTSFRRLKTRRRRARTRLSATVESLGALSGNLKARLRADLIRIYGPLKVSFVEMASLANGMRITVGHDLYYGSVRGTLAALEEELQH